MKRPARHMAREVLPLALAAIVTLSVALWTRITPASPSLAPSLQITRSAVMPKWEAVSIKACILSGGGLVEGRGGAPVSRGGGPPRSSPGRMDFPCSTVMQMIGQAYFIYA